ncbi:MAG: tetratricopeptide repeat protein [Opitutaceae bacterium]|nr:tetratricopeptide repeat protein [Opitutaceae bacterium]
MSDPIPVRRAAWRDAAAAAALFASVILAYAAVFRAGFIWDDDINVTENAVIVGPLGLKEIWTTSAANYFPLVLTNFWLQHALWGLNPTGFHAVTLACHALSALFLWLVLLRLDVPGAWLGAALWALHPVQVESVAWITELKNTQSAVFFLLSIWFWLRWLEVGRRRFYFLSLVCALLALLSKPSTVMLPVALGLCVWWRRGGPRWHDARALAPFFALSAIVSAWTIWEQKFHSGALGAEWAQSFPERLAIAGRAVWFYLGKLAWPDPLLFIYPRWEISVREAATWLPLSAALTAGLILAGWLRRGGGRPVFFATAYFVALLFPVLGFFDVYFFRYAFVGDHFQYLASMGPLALAGAAATQLRRRAAVAISSAVLVACAALAAGHARDFADSETLWRATLTRHPAAAMAWLNLGATLAKQGRDEEAIACFQRSAAIRPGDVQARNDAGWGLVNSGYPAAAVPLLAEVLRLKPDHAEAHNNLGNALRRLGRLDEAAAHYSRSLALKPGSAEAHNNLGGILAETGRHAEAMAQFEEAIRLAPKFAPAHANLGAALCLSSRWAEAIVPFETALRLRRDYPDAHRQLGIALANAGRMSEAAVSLAVAVRQTPDSAELHQNLGQVLVALGRAGEAAPHFERAKQIQAGAQPPPLPPRR